MRFAAVLIVLSSLAGAGFWLYPHTTHCALCPPIRCATTKICGKGCVCIKPGGQVLGYCASID